MRNLPLKIALLIIFLASFPAFSQQLSQNELTLQVKQTENAFAKTMADRDFSAFSAFLSSEAVFFSSTKVLHGKDEVANAWKPLFEKTDAPFSWTSGQVEVLSSGTLALSTGPVYNASGKLVGNFTSIWRLDGPGVWHIVFDKGNDVCNCSEHGAQ